MKNGQRIGKTLRSKTRFVFWSFLGMVAAALSASCAAYTVESIWPINSGMGSEQAFTALPVYLLIGAGLLASVAMASALLSLQPLRTPIQCFTLGAVCSLGQLTWVTSRIGASVGELEFIALTFVAAVSVRIFLTRQPSSL